MYDSTRAASDSTMLTNGSLEFQQQQITAAGSYSLVSVGGLPFVGPRLRLKLHFRRSVNQTISVSSSLNEILLNSGDTLVRSVGIGNRFLSPSQFLLWSAITTSGFRKRKLFLAIDSLWLLIGGFSCWHLTICIETRACHGLTSICRLIVNFWLLSLCKKCQFARVVSVRSIKIFWVFFCFFSFCECRSESAHSGFKDSWVSPSDCYCRLNWLDLLFFFFWLLFSFLS